MSKNEKVTLSQSLEISSMSSITELQKEYNIKLLLSDKAKHRHLKSAILHLLDDRMFENPDMDVDVI